MQHLRSAISAMPDVVNISPLYRTEPVGGPDNQAEYFNAVVELRTKQSPRDVLELAQELETNANRVRTVKNGPRTLDVDVLLYDNERIDEPDLVVPHPRMWQRQFVVQPLADIAPELVSESAYETAMGEVKLLMQYWASSTS